MYVNKILQNQKRIKYTIDNYKPDTESTKEIEQRLFPDDK